MAGWLSALRVARREARRAKGRSTLVVALIGLPALALTFAAVSYDSFTLTQPERLARDLGTADAQVSWVTDGPVDQQDAAGRAWVPAGAGRPALVDPSARTAEDVRALLPGATEMVPRRSGFVRLTTAAGVGELATEALDLTSPLARGIAHPTSGRAPRTAGEMALTDQAAERLGAAVGDQVELADGSSRFTVVGMVEFPDRLSDEIVVFHPDRLAGETLRARWLVATPEPVSWQRVTELNQHGLLVYSRAVALDPPAELRRLDSGGDGVGGRAFGTGVLVAGLGILEVVLLAGPAFAVGARRRQRDLALIAAGGGTPAHLRRIVLADGMVLGALGAGAGIALGMVAALVARPLVAEYLVGARPGDYRVFPLALAGIAAVAIGTGLLAALVPAVTAARQPVVAALAGRRGGTRARTRWLVLGLTLVALGGTVTGVGAWQVDATVVLAGLVAGQLGLALCTPTIVGLVARLGSRLPLAPRVALRDTARNRSAAAPAISAVMAAVAGAAAAGMVVLSLDQQDSGPQYLYPLGTAVAGGPWEFPEDPAASATVHDAQRAARANLPVDQLHVVSLVDCGPRPGEAPPGDSGSRAGECLVTVAVPAENQCPYWDASWPLSRADQRAASQDPRCDSSPEPNLTGFVEVVDDGTALATLTGAEPEQVRAGAAALRGGGVVVTDNRYLNEDGTATIQVAREDGSGHAQPDDSITVPARLVPVDNSGLDAVLSPGMARELGVDTRPGPLLASTTRTPTQAEEDAFVAAMTKLEGYGSVVREADSQVAPMLLLLAAAAGVVALGAAGIATGLAAADRRPDLATLGAVGASPRVRRSLSLSQSGVIAGLGTGLGLLAGLGAAIAVLVALNQRYASTWPSPEPYPITVPLPVLAVLLVVPLLAMLGAGLLTRSRLPIERRRT